MIKLIATDMDGTLLDAEGNIPHHFMDLLVRLEQKGIYFVIASGRSYFDLKDFFQDASHYLHFICDNGAYIVSQQHPSQISLLKKELIIEVINHCKSIPNVKVILSGPKGMYATPCEPQFEPILKHYFSNIKLMTDMDEIDEPIHRICICDLDNPMSNSYPILNKLYGDKFKVTVSGDIWLDVTNQEVNKGTALKKLQHVLNISKSQTMAFGDYYNDIEMLQEAAYSFVMENANSDMFQYGNFIAKSHTENGVTQAIEEMIF